MIKFSVVIPLFNKEEYIERAIRSVIEQSYKDFEIIVVDDGSTDNSRNVVLGLESKKIELFEKENGGESSARNYGIKEAKGEFICFLDGDDMFLESHLHNLNALIKKYPKHCFFSTNYYNKFPGQEKQSIAITTDIKDGVIKDYFMESKEIPLVTSNTACIKKSVFRDLGNFDTSLRFGPDLEMWFRIALHHQLVYSSIPTAVYFRDADNRVMDNYRSFNDDLIVKMISVVKDIESDKSIRLYIEANLIKQVKYHLLKGKNKLVRSKLESYKPYFVRSRTLYFYKFLAYLPLQRILRR